MSQEIKKEVVDPTELEDRILDLCKQFPKGINDSVLQNDMPLCEASQRVTALNKLLSGGKIELLKQGKALLYRLKDSSSIQNVKGADNEEKLVLQIIEEAGNKGIWIRDIRYKCNLLLTQVNKILRNLESKKLIKAVKSVAASKKKVYMLYNLQPDRSVTGGAWYSDQDFESEFVEVLNQQCYKFLHQKHNIAVESNADPISQRNASYGSLKEVWKYISDLGISKVSLSPEDIEAILNTLIYDGKVERRLIAVDSDKDEDSKLFRAVEPMISTAGLMSVPCGVCPVHNECEIGGIISPTTCRYIKEWLNF